MHIPSLITEPFSSLPGYIRRKSSHDRDHPREMKHGYVYFDENEGARVFLFFIDATGDASIRRASQDAKTPRTREILKAPLREGRILIVAGSVISFFFFPSVLVYRRIFSPGIEFSTEDVSARSLRRFKENNLSKISPSRRSSTIVNDVAEKQMQCIGCS